MFTPSVLHFSTADMLGGSARSANRIHRGIRERGIRSRMLVGFRQGDDPDVKAVAGLSWLAWTDRVFNKVGGALGLQYRLVPSSIFLPAQKWVQQADIIQLFNTHGGYMSLGALKKIARDRPVVWRLSDMWPMTGHCAYPGKCVRWLTGCGRCPDLDAYPPIGIDRSKELFKAKQHLYEKLDLTIVAPSSWMLEMARRSPLLGRFPSQLIHNGFDDRAFRNIDRVAARQSLGLPENAKVILFSAHVLDNNPRKGGEVLMAALREVGVRPDWVLALMGQGGDSWNKQIPMPVYRLGFKNASAEMAQAYVAADVVVIPSILENLPNTLIESLAAGRAVVGSDTGGMKDGVIQERTGLLSKVGDYRQLAADLIKVLDNDVLRRVMEHEARVLFEKEFMQCREIDRFEGLYRGLVAPLSS